MVKNYLVSSGVILTKCYKFEGNIARKYGSSSSTLEMEIFKVAVANSIPLSSAIMLMENCVAPVA